MTADKHWVGLKNEEFRDMLFALIGFRFGREPETRLPETREEQQNYAGKFLKMVGGWLRRYSA